jgi:hypothetical protein
MKEKYDQKYEDHIQVLAEHRLDSKNYKIFDHRSRIIKRHKISELLERGRSDSEDALVIISGEGDLIVLTEEFERMLLSVSKKHFS